RFRVGMVEPRAEHVQTPKVAAHIVRNGIIRIVGARAFVSEWAYRLTLNCKAGKQTIRSVLSPGHIVENQLKILRVHMTFPAGGFDSCVLRNRYIGSLQVEYVILRGVVTQRVKELRTDHIRRSTHLRIA